ncbi:MAG TPA: peptidoglycan-binding protein, partial [Candidatus Paceibacterota bacterium]|nr:peptidoglycan-binding protein [Candidatus Paceibacterota bacterium]
MTNKKIVGLALAAVLLPAVASAATIEELQAQINALMAQLSAAKPATTASCSVVLSKTLKMGMSDAEVMDLQKALNSDVATQVAASGVGSKGNETSYFGAATKAAVVKFQNKYASEVLAPAGLSTGTGLVGAATRAKINALCSATVTTPTTTT